MRLGLYCNHFNWPGGDAAIRPVLTEFAQQAESAGFASFWLMDHFFQLPRHGAIDDPMLEAYSALSFIAGITNQMQLGTMVTGVTYRNPGVLVKAVTTLDVLSGGRAALGIGAAWFDREHDGLGISFPPLKVRFEMLEETLQIAHQMWGDNPRAVQWRAFPIDRADISTASTPATASPHLRRRSRRAEDLAPGCALRGRLQLLDVPSRPGPLVT